MRVRAGVIGELTCGGFCDDSRESVIGILSEIGHPMEQVWCLPDETDIWDEMAKSSKDDGALWRL